MGTPTTMPPSTLLHPGFEQALRTTSFAYPEDLRMEKKKR